MSRLSPTLLMALQAAKAGSLEPIRATTGERMSASDAAACAAGLPGNLYRAARVRWAEDPTCVMELARDLWVSVAGDATRLRWIVGVGEERLRSLALLAVLELLAPRVIASPSQRREFLGYSPVDWFRVWEPRYTHTFRRVWEWSDQAGEHMVQKQEREDWQDGDIAL